MKNSGPIRGRNLPGSPMSEFDGFVRQLVKKGSTLPPSLNVEYAHETTPTSGYRTITDHCSSILFRLQTSSASRKAIQGCEAKRIPTLRAEEMPRWSWCNTKKEGVGLISASHSNFLQTESASKPVPSVDPSLMMINSETERLWVQTLTMASRMKRRTLRAGMTTLMGTAMR